MMDKNIYYSLLHLLEIIDEVEIKTFDFIRFKYIEKNTLYEQTLQTALDLKLIYKNDDHLTSNIIGNNNSKAIKIALKQYLMNDAITQDFLSIFYFDVTNNAYSAILSESELIKYDSIRKILVDIDFIDLIQEKYIIIDANFCPKKKYTPKQFSKDIKNKEHIGYEAEILVLEYERKKLKNYQIDIAYIEHTSQINVAAGFDIKSFDEASAKHGVYIPKYIEVKAVNQYNNNFFWSKNEIDTAKHFNDKYYLYLVSMINKNPLDIDKVLIIKNPYKNVFNNDIWSKECESYSIKKRKINEQYDDTK